MELFLFLNFSPTRQWLDFWAHWSATKSFVQKIPIFQQNLKNDHAPQNLRRDHAPSKIWEATMLHQKMNMIVFLQTDFSNYGGTLFLGSKNLPWMEVFIFLNDHAPEKFEKWPCSKKFEKRPCSIKNLRSDHAPSKNKYDRSPPKCDKWSMVIFQIMVEPFS